MAASLELLQIYAYYRLANPVAGTAKDFYDWLESLKTELDIEDGKRSSLDGVSGTGSL